MHLKDGERMSWNTEVHAFKNSGLYQFTCKCGRKEFKAYNEVYEERGIGEYDFDCKCGKQYHFAYGRISIKDRGD